MSKTIYTAIFGHHDDLKEPLVITEGWKYVVFTDQDLTSKVWEIRKVPQLPEGPTYTARYYKILFHHHIHSDIVMWLDASFYINCNLDEWIIQRFIPPVSMMKHHLRDCVYDEGRACIRNKRANEQSVRDHIEKHRLRGVPAHDGMGESGITIRIRSEQAIQFSEMWWEELNNGCLRDQIAFGYVNWKMPITNFIDWNYDIGTEFLYVPHFKYLAKRLARLSSYQNKNLIKTP